MDPHSHNRKKRIFRIAVFVICASLVVTVTVLGVVWTASLRNADNLLSFQESLRSLGVGGWVVLFAIQYIQIVVAFIPGGPIQIAAGALFGPWGGMLICLTGTVSATMTIFALIKKYGHRALNLLVDEKDTRKYKFLSDAKRLEFLTLVLFFIPGTPKDALTYLFALTPITLSRFMLISTLARIPAMLTSVLAGDSVAEGQWLKAFLLFAGVTAISVCGFLLHKLTISPHLKK